MSKKFTIAIIVSFCILLFSVCFSLINIFNTKIIKGVYINGIDVSHLTKDEAIYKVNKVIETKKNNNISIYINENTTKEVNFDSLNIKYNAQDCVNQAYNLGRSNNIFKSNFEILFALINKKNVSMEVNLNVENLKTLVDDINCDLPNKLIESDYYIENRNLIINKGISGFVVNEALFKDDLYTNLNNFNILTNSFQVNLINKEPKNIDINEIYNEIHKDAENAHYESNPFKVYPEIVGVSFNIDYAKSILEKNLEEYVIPLDYSSPEITIDNLGIDIFKNSLSYYSTKYNPLNLARSNNLEIAASKIDGIILSPGEVFSYNKTVGARTIEAGYKEAAIYSDGKVVDGIGGGICQISSTLYNSAVLANLEIIERHNHQFLTSYAPPGRDATVVYGSKDLKFKNTRSYPIKIEIKVQNGLVNCTILGLSEDNEPTIDFNIETIYSTEPSIKYEYDSKLEDNTEHIKQKGSNSMYVKVYKVEKNDGSIVSKTLLSEDYYKSLDKIIVKKYE